MPQNSRRADLLLLSLAVVGGVLFFARVGDLWPLVDVPLTRSPTAIAASARPLLAELGFDLEDYESAAWVRVDTAALDYVEATFGREQTQRWVAQGLPLAQERAQFKRRGEVRSVEVALSQRGALASLSQEVEEDDGGERIDAGRARDALWRVLEDRFGLSREDWEERTAAIQERPSRRDHSFVSERYLSREPELRERLTATVAGDEVVLVDREVVVPAAFRRQRRAAEAPGRAMESVGLALAALSALFAVYYFLDGLRCGRVRLRLAVLPPIAVLLCLLLTYALQEAYLFRVWEPLWPRWISTLQNVVWRISFDAWMALVLLAFVAAGEAMDREAEAGRTTSLWSFFRGHWLERGVALASGRGFLVGLVCGGVLAAGALVVESVAGARTVLQPRGFFFYALNSASPMVSTLLFFFNVALLEELGYRLFAGSWMLRTFPRARWLAVVAPALLYGLTHVRLDFLPPADPVWARPLLLTLVGLVWGGAFLRWDALTVVLSHWSADLLIFNWPRLASGEPVLVVKAVATLAFPLLPAFVYLLLRGFREERKR